MDIDEADLKQLFLIIDEDHSGEIDPEEFIEFLYRMRNAESTTTTKFVKHLVEGLDKKSSVLMQKVSKLEALHNPGGGLDTPTDGAGTPTEALSPRSRTP